MTRPSILPFALFVSLLAACGPKFTVAEGGTGEVGAEDGASGEGDTGAIDSAEPDTSMWDNATLVVTSPASGDFLPLGQTTTFEAHIIGADGVEMDFDEIAWKSDVDTAWGLTGAQVEDGTLGVGTHTITATAVLPNGDRLTYALGGILVQHEDAGTYVGDLMVDLTATYNGTDYTATCIGAATVVIDAYGETGLGSSSCTVSLFGYDIAANHDFNFEIADGAVGGEAAVDLFFTSYAFDAVGAVGDGELTADWAQESDFFDIVGDLAVTRITRDVEPVE